MISFLSSVTSKTSKESNRSSKTKKSKKTKETSFGSSLGSSTLSEIMKGQTPYCHKMLVDFFCEKNPEFTVTIIDNVYTFFVDSRNLSARFFPSDLKKESGPFVLWYADLSGTTKCERHTSMKSILDFIERNEFS